MALKLSRSSFSRRAAARACKRAHARLTAYDAASRITGITQQLAASRRVFVSGTSGPMTTVYFNTPVSWTVGYDSRDRIISFNRNSSALSRASTAYTYDANSNRLSALIEQISDTDLNNSFTAADTAARTAQTSSLASNSNRLLGFSQTLSSVRNGITLSSSTSTTNYTRDAAGNLTSDGLRVFEYDSQNRHSKTIVNDPDEGSKITYLHNALGQRVFKSEPKVDHVAPNATVLGTPFVDWLRINFGWLFAQAQLDPTLGQSYLYDDAQLGSTPVLLAEYGNGSSNMDGRREYIWLPTQDGQAIAIALYRGVNFNAIHTDHLGTPRKVTNWANNTDWQLPYSAFGENAPSGGLQVTTDPTQAYTTDTATATMLAVGPSPISFNFRFPGQYFDDESKLNYNYFRSYQAGQGRYSQSDPIGLAGGLNRYQYAESNPLSNTDPLGLFGVVGAGFGAGIELSIQAYKNYRDECDLFDLDNYDWWDVGVAAAVGAVAPGAISVGKTAWTSGNAAKNLSAQLTRARTPNRVAKLQGRLDAHTGAIIEAVATQGAWQGYQIVGKQLNGKSPRDCTCKR